MLIQGAILCLAMNIYHEARGEPIKGQIAVGTVTMNRANWDVKEICPVVYAPKQFSWTSLKKNPYRYPPKEDKSWQRARELAKKIVEGELQDVTKGATFFHAHHVKPTWRHAFERTVVIGNHVFYANR
ncbi:MULTISPECIES: cell wall hydrolase [Pantoea]|uniref:Cell wall hydrolase n=2 Tax=Pantoea trifolii TaxID=2968030 RepID=A0ABT1VQE8_9GAMM|nr:MULTISPECIES: cell wall hydrolase [unclassified Pantoea]MCQ8229067.1 cell wall hydrolase [Pantoea sp. MMK2]MCW6031648.1 cell wall hydrolase [Pantoea sp. JK]